MTGKEISEKIKRSEKKTPVKAYISSDPEGRKADCHRDTGLDPKTIRKWWDKIS